MGTENRRKLKKDAVPTLFCFVTTQRKRRESSINRTETVSKKQLVEEALETNSHSENLYVDTHPVVDVTNKETPTLKSDQCVGTVDVKRKSVRTQCDPLITFFNEHTKKEKLISTIRINKRQKKKEIGCDTEITFSPGENVEFFVRKASEINPFSDLESSAVTTLLILGGPDLSMM